MRRRDVIKSALLGGIAGITGLGCATGGPAAGSNGAATNGAGRRRPVRNIIFFAYDGFNFEDLSIGRYFAARRELGDLEVERLMGAGSAGAMLSHSLTSVVTDSAAASAAWAVGRKVVNGSVSMYPDGRELTTILELAKGAGKATGLITTTRLTHATPAAWVARVPDRAMEDEIAAQYLDFQPNVLLGGGSRHFTADRRADGRDLEGEFERSGYHVLRTAADLRRPRGGRVFGAFTPDHLPYEIDRRFQDESGPSLAEITRAGLDVLDRESNGFVVQIEAGRIDHANHDNDPGASLWDILAADEALKLVRAFVDRTPDTLLIVASDHATGGQALYGFGPGYNHSTQAFETIDRRRASHSHLRWVLPEQPSAAEIGAAVRDYLGVQLTGAQAEAAVSVLAREVSLGHPTAHGDNPARSFYQLISHSETRAPDRPNINFATGAHTAGLVPLFTYGAWDGPPNLGVVDNTELFYWMTRAIGVDFRNPEMTEAAALRLGALGSYRDMVVR